jgi:hypothetical protein
MVKHPQHVNAISGYYMSVYDTSCSRIGRKMGLERLKLAQAPHRNGSSVAPQGNVGNTPLHAAAYYGISKFRYYSSTG